MHPIQILKGFEDKPVNYQWQLIQYAHCSPNKTQCNNSRPPRRTLSILSHFLNVADESQAQVLDELANQDELFLSFYGDDLRYRFTKTVEHDEQQWQLLDELVQKANYYWEKIPPEQRDFDLAKWEFMIRYE